MPDDDIFPNDQDTPATEGGDTSANQADSQGQPDFTKSVQEAVEAQTAPLVESMNRMAQAISALQERSTPPDNTDPPKGRGNGADDDVYSRFLDDPKGTIRTEAVEEISKRLGPGLRILVEATKDSVIDAHRSEIDKDFGEGTWNEIFKEDVEATLKELPVEMQASKAHVLHAVSAIYGQKYRDAEARKILEERRAKVQEAEMDTPRMLVGTGRPAAAREELTSDEKTFLDSLNRSGYKVDKASYLANRKRGHTESAWEGAFKDAEK